MGSFLSFPTCSRTHAGKSHDNSQLEACKRIKMTSTYNDNARIIPVLPDEISLQILARLPRIHYLKVRLVSRSWKAAITGKELYCIRKEIAKTEDWLYIMTKTEDDKLVWHALDPISTLWQRLPPMPDLDHDESKINFSMFNIWNIFGSSMDFTDVIRGWLGRGDALRRIPFCGCAIGAVDGCLYVLGGFSKASAMNCVWKYDPRTNNWLELCPMTTARAFCKTGLLNNKLYVVGGVSRGRSGLTPLQSCEMYDPKLGVWTPVASMPFSKAQVLPTAFLAEMLKPIATGMTSYRGKLCVPQSLYSWPFFVDVGGEIYDPERDMWLEMPAGMGEGWPARQAGTKLSVVVDGELYALDPSSSNDSGRIKFYDHQEDAWKVIIERVPVHDSSDSESPYLLAGCPGKLHVITKDDNNDTAVLQAELHNNRRTSSCSSSSTSSDKAVLDKTGYLLHEDNDAWKVIAIKSFGSADLVSCQVLNM